MINKKKLKNINSIICIKIYECEESKIQMGAWGWWYWPALAGG
mgnify:CR=1 FL=1